MSVFSRRMIESAFPRFLPAIVLVLVMLLSGGASGQDMAELEIDHALTFDFPTPHTEWARPYAGGKMRVLFFSDGMGTNPRECVELMQRFDIDAQAVFWAQIVDSKESHWHGGDLGERRMLNLLEQKWDCFVFLGLPFSKVPSQQQLKILQAVMQGAGVVFVGTDGTGLLQKYSRLAALPPFLAGDFPVEAYTLYQGKGICLPNRPSIDYYEGWEVEYDHWQERLGRAVMWAAGKEPPVQLDLKALPASPAAAGSSGHAHPSVRLTAKLSGNPASRDLKLQVSLCRPGDEPVILPPIDAPVGKTLEIAAPVLPNGTWHADARVVSSAGVETWATRTFEVHSGRFCSELKLNRSWGEPGGVISGTVSLSGTKLPGEVLRVQLLDRRRRELVRKDIPVTGQSTGFEFGVPEWLPMLVTVDARLLSNGNEIDRAYEYFRVTKRKQDGFNFLMWDAPLGTLAPYAEESLAKTGITLQLAMANPPFYLAAFDVSWVPYTTRILVDKTPEGIMKPFCWNDEDAVKKEAEALASLYKPSREHGANVYSLGDENKTQGSCLSPFCAGAYMTFLQESYGSIGALNSSWQTKFKSWEEVGLSIPSDNDEANSKAQKNYPRWFDRQAFKSWNYVHYCLKYAKAYKTIDPLARTGFEGGGGFATGDDVDLIVRKLDFWSPYSGLADEVIRSTAPRKFVRANWMGYQKDPDSLLQRYWRMVVLGMDSVWWWRWEGIGRFHGWLAPDLRPFPSTLEVLKDTQVVRDGLGDLLLHSTMQDDGIAVLYSYPSTFATKLKEGMSYGKYEDAHTAVIKFIRDSGFQFRYVTDRMLRMGEFDASKCKILFLPRAEAIGDKEAEVIREFVENGGTAVADLRPGLYDDHCKPRARGVLDELFGINRLARTAAKSVNLSTGSSTMTAFVDDGVVLEDSVAGQQVRGATPVFVTRQFGKGRAILLNSEMRCLGPLLSTQEVVERGGGIAANGMNRTGFLGFEPAIKLSGVDGKPPEDADITRWRDGGMDIVSIFRQNGKQEDITVSLPATRFVYDLRGNSALGLCERFTTTILPNRASFFVLADKPVPSPGIRLEKTVVPQGTVVKAAVSVSVPGAEGMHAVKIRVEAGDRRLDWFDRVLIIGQDPARVEFPVAFNDPVGDYRIILTDLFSSGSSEAILKVNQAAVSSANGMPVR